MSEENNDLKRLSRRNLLKAGAAAGVAAALPAGPAQAAQPVAGSRGGGSAAPELTFVNGRIHTMDDDNSVVSSVAIRDGRFVAVGNAANPGPGSNVVNLHGRTVVPGIIESHTHFVSLANRPGYHVAQWELASNVAGVLALLAARRAAQPEVPPGQFITAMGAGTPRMFAELRLPTLAEIDSVVPDRPVFLYQGGGGPARTNSEGKKFFESVTSPLAGPCVVGADGTIAGGNPNMANRALYHLRIRQTFEDKKRSALDAMAFSASVGITAVLDQTLVAAATGTLNPASLDPQPTDPLFTLNHYRMYDAWRALHREDRALIRLQINFLHNQGYIPELGDLDHQLPELRERLKNQFFFFGDDMLRTGAIGEWAAPFATPSNANGYAVWYEAQRLVAKAGWRNENAQGSVAGIEQVVSTYEAMDREFGIKDLRWGLQAVDLATPDQLARLKVLNCGVSMSGFRWLNGVPRADGAPVGPLFPQIIASGIPAALHEDGVHIAPHNPWFAMHYATTGLNVLGQQINAGQQITRQQALHGYTRAAAWYLNRENEMGSIEVGKFADLVVLDRDYFSVSDAQARQTRPVLTVVDGKIAYDAGAV
ncbi:MAG: twin-arginine translocation signal domain-containing protein [Betaproteobacteria bacterium]|nr:MAG: twin-arginine translocation signal domain-containing protein [Betaproteobacteria bacterium]